MGYPEQNSAFVAAMEDAGDLPAPYAERHFPLICFDEAAKQLIANKHELIKMKPRRPPRTDYEYERNDTANLFMFFAPLESWRHVNATNRRTTVDYAHALKVSDAQPPSENQKNQFRCNII